MTQPIKKVQRGEEIISNNPGKSVRLIPPQENSSPRKPGGSWEGKVWLADDFDQTPQEVIESFYGNSESVSQHPAESEMGLQALDI